MTLQRNELEPTLKGMGYTNITNKDIYKKGTQKEFYAVDFHKSEDGIPFKWVDNERIEDINDTRLKDDDEFIMLYNLVTGNTDGVHIPEDHGFEDIHGHEPEVLPPDDNTPLQHEEETEELQEEHPIKRISSYPINGIKGIVPQLCECGKIKIGKKGKMTQSRKGTSFRPPEKLDHFVVTTMQKTGEDDFETDEEIMSKLTSNCTEIPVMLMYDTPDLNFVTSLAYYDSAACKCRGDGERAIKEDGTEITCNPETCPFAQQKKCKPNGVLSVVIMDAPRVGGVWKFRTTGWNSIRNLMSSIEFIYGLTGGRLAGLPLMLTLQPKSTVVPGTSTKTTIYMVNMEYRGTMSQLMNSANTRYVSEERMQMLEAKAKQQLELPESPEECKDIQEEFYPDNIKEL